MGRSVVMSLLSSLCLASGVGTAAQQPPPAPTGVIVGRVVDAQSSAPIPGVVVGLSGGSLARGSEPSVITDAQGRFAFRGLAKGAYTIAATMSGSGFSPNGFVLTGMGFPIGPYLSGGVGQRRPNGPLQPIDLADGQRIEDALIRLWKPAAIGGQVLDEAGEPLVGQVVGVVQISSDGRLLTGPTVKTDDRGAFRLGTLVPGTYIVFVPQTRISMPISVGEDLAFGPPDPAAESRFAASGAPRRSLGGVPVGSSVVSATSELFGGSGGLITSSLGPIRNGDTILAYPTTFYPSAATASQAGRITLGSGEERNVSVSVRPLPCASISGTLTDDVGPVPNMGVHLLPGDLDDEASILEAGWTATDARGAFVLPAVPSGQYTIVVFRPSGVPTGNPQQPIADVARVSDQPGAWAAQPVTVGDRPVENLTMRVKAPVTVTGDVRFVGASPPPPPERLRGGAGAVTIWRTRGVFRSPGASPGSPIDMTAGGRIVIKGVSPPGRYFAGPPTLPAPWSLESVTIGGRDVTDAGFRIDETDIADLVITYTDKPAGITGTVAPGANAGDAETSVCLMPANRARWAEARLSTKTFRFSRTTKSGTFSWPNVPPGDYLVVAIRDVDAGDWPDEKFLAKLAAVATPIKILPGQQAGLSLTVSVLR
jgi:hypothetical protein